MGWLKKKLLSVTFYFCKRSSEKYVGSVCGHEIKTSGTVSVFGKEIKFTLSNPQNSTYCMECYANMAIQCAWCGELIMVGDPITLYTPKKSFEVPEHAVVHQKDPLQLVGCLGWDCAQSGMDRAGFWQEPGKVHRVLSPAEIVTATGDTVICSDLSDINKTTPMPPKK